MSPVLESDHEEVIAGFHQTSLLSPRSFSSAIIEFAQQHPVIVVSISVLSLIVLRLRLGQSKRQRLVLGVPIVGGSDRKAVLKNRKRFIHDGKDMLREGYEKSKGGFFYVPSVLGERLMIPVKYLEDLKTAPINEVDFVGTFIEMFEGKYTTMGSRSTLHPRVVKAQLNHHLFDVMPDIQEEIVDAFEEDFPCCDEWTEINVVDNLTKIVARVSSRMFGGRTLSRNKKWVAASIAFAIDGFHGAQKLKKVPFEFLKPLAARFIPEIRRIKEYYKTAERAAIPLLNSREEQGDHALDLLYWMSEQAKGDEKDKKFIAGILLKVSFAAIHTSAAAPSQLIFDLCEMPQYIEPLREEIRNAMGPDNHIDKKGFLQMSKMDSIMKESQRFSPLLLITFERIVTKDYHLSDGFVIPANTTIGVPTQAITMNEANYPNPKVYDAFRFDTARKEEPSTSGRTQYAASNPASMSFGFGRHACPGRFFAANEIKAIMAYLVDNYDFKFADGQKRPESLLFETQYLPNPTATVLFKRRTPRRGKN